MQAADFRRLYRSKTSCGNGDKPNPDYSKWQRRKRRGGGHLLHLIRDKMHIFLLRR